MKFSAKSDRGRVRKINQDSFGYHVGDDGTCFLIVADGMGGHNAGEIASAVAVNTFITGSRSENAAEASFCASDFIKTAMKSANDTIIYKANADPSNAGMGTTAVTAIIGSDRLTVGNIGDSRAYMISGGGIRQITTDHSYVEMLLEAGSISPDEARVHPRRNEITRALGVVNYEGPDIFVTEYSGGDVLVLCSDGLNKMISDDALCGIVLEARGADGEISPDEICTRLIDAANESGGTDNITVIAAVL